MLLHLGKLVLERLHAAADVAAVGLDLGFTGTSGADAASETGHLDALSRQTRQEIFELSQLDLQLALLGARTQREDIEYQGGAVDDAHVGVVFDVFDLGGRQLAVHHDEVKLLRFADLFDLLELARADEGRAFGALQLLRHGKGRLCACGLDKLLQLRERRLRVKAARIDTDKQRAGDFFFVANHIHGFVSFFLNFIANLLFTNCLISSII